MKKSMIVLGIVLAAGSLFARPHGGFGGPRGGFGGPRGGFGGHGFSRPAPMMHHAGPMHRMPMHRPMPPPPPRHHYYGYRGGYWGHGGSCFWPGFVGGVVGGVVGSVITDAVVGPAVVASSVVTAPAVVTQPVVTTPVYAPQQVWVPGAYVDQVQPNGVVVRVWQPGHYEMR